MITIEKKHQQQAIRTTLDLGRVIFDGDRDLRAQLVGSKRLAKFWKELEASGFMAPVDSHRQQLLKKSIRLTPGIAPAFWKCVEHCRGVLGLDATIDVFCIQDPSPNAFVTPPYKNHITMGFTSGALESLSDGEICSVIGHELGHVLFEHFQLRGLLSFEEDERLAPIDAIRLYAWMRYAELSADRVGLLCCDDFDTAILAQFKLASGLSDPRVIGNVKEAALQYASLKAEAIERDADDWFTTHPYGPLRIKSLDLFAQSRTFHELRGRAEGTLSEAELEREVAEVIDLMNPAFLNEKGTCKAETRAFLVFGGVEIALADRKLKRSELDAIRSLAGEGRLADNLDEIAAMTEEQRGDQIIAAANVLNLKLPVLRRRKIIEDMTAIALADRKVDDSERSILYALCNALGIPPIFIDETLSRPAAALD
jgi:uncharacterized tellurite resistance protein B-like protein